MASVHFLNVSPGDCTVIQHGSNRVSMIDMCDGNIQTGGLNFLKEAASYGARPKGNFGMCNRPTNPVSYLQKLGITSIFRFALTHPDMDHMDGFNNLLNNFKLTNFWDTGSRRDKPDFSGSPYKEEDWDSYVAVRDNQVSGVKSVIRHAGDRFEFANKQEDGSGGGDGLYILAPDSELIKDCNMNDDLNDGSYVILYRSAGGRVLITGDAHDKSWEYILEHYKSDVANCSFMLAPHHGRDSNRSYDFLDHIQPKLTLIGCSPSEYIDYGQWERRDLTYITSNQAGNVVLEVHNGALNVYIENEKYAEAKGVDIYIRNSQGYVHLYTIPKTEEMS
jgi:beta-lactamase superfamily II metal-dependent hydrolase